MIDYLSDTHPHLLFSCSSENIPGDIETAGTVVSSAVLMLGYHLADAE